MSSNDCFPGTHLVERQCDVLYSCFFFHEKSRIFSQKILFRLVFPDILRGLVLMNLILAILWYSFDMTVQEDPPYSCICWDQFQLWMGPKKVLVVLSILLLFHLRVIVVHPGSRYYIWIYRWVYIPSIPFHSNHEQKDVWLENPNSFIDTTGWSKLLGSRHGSDRGPIASRRLQVIDGGPTFGVFWSLTVLLWLSRWGSEPLPFSHTQREDCSRFLTIYPIFKQSGFLDGKTVAVFLEGWQSLTHGDLLSTS